MPADGIDAASSNNGGLGMPPFCGQLSGAQFSPVLIQTLLIAERQG